MKITCTAFVLLIHALQCLALDDSPFQLKNKDAGFCLVKRNNQCNEMRWTTGDRLLVHSLNKCVGVQGKSVGSEVSLYDCDENSDLQKWECRNGTVLTLKGQELFIELSADNTAVLSKTIGPNNQIIIADTSSGACARTYREYFAIGGNAAGKPCMFPFKYEDHWYSDCTEVNSPDKQLWCAVETKYEINELWGYCPAASKAGWNAHPTTGAYYQPNMQAALTWAQADTSCKQQGASLLSINDPHEQAYVTAILGAEGNKLWMGLILDPDHGWKWSNGKPFRYLKWDSGHPLLNPGHSCAFIDPAVQYSWQSSTCDKKLGYICYRKATEAKPTHAAEQGFCSRSWISYNGHCFHLNRTERTWTDAQRECRNEGGDLVSIRNVEDQSFVISQLGYTSRDELWIGLNDKKTEGLFDWIDHSTVSFTNWEFRSPAVSEIKNCVLMKGEKGNWADRVCEEKHGFICMKMSASIPTGDVSEPAAGCKSGWRRHGSYCYFIGTQTKTFNEAKDDCKSSDSYLADVSNGVDNAFLVSLVGLRPEKYFWLGLSNQDNIDQFVWTNRRSVRFTHWNAQMPGHQQGCVAMTTGVFAGLWDVLPCTNKEKYICKHLAEGAVLTRAPPTLSPALCTIGWTSIRTRPYCFKLFMQSSSVRKSWYEARDYCRAIGGDLLSIHSAEEQKLLPDRYDKVWIGLSAPDPVTGYVWSDGSPVQFQHWQDGEPNNKNNVESCTEFDLDERESSGSWNDVHCETYHNWLCQIRAGVTPKNISPSRVTPEFNRTSDGWIEWNGTQYYINSRTMAMEEARRSCQQRHGDLVSINSEAEAVFLWKQVSRNYGSYWIGLNVELDRTYEWMDGSPVVFQRWDENQPTFLRNDENCAVMTSSMGFWRDYNCGYEHRSICKRSRTPFLNATVAPTVLPKGGCPPNWIKFESKCYSIVNRQKEIWDGAKTQCAGMGGKLVSISSRSVQVFLTTQLAEANTTNLWLGLYNVRGYPFLWTDGRPMRYSNWGQENNHHIIYHSELDYDLPARSQRTCVAMTTNPDIGIGKWIKRSCNDTNGYVCRRNLDSSIPDSPEPTISSDYVQILNDSIKVVTQQMNWDAAKTNCESDGAKLASLRNDWTQVYAELLALKLKSPIWIGMNKMQTGGYFRFIDGWHFTFTKWDRNEPNMEQNCVFLTADGKWKTGDCNRNLNSICMKSSEVPPTESDTFPGFCPSEPEMPRYRNQANIWMPFKANCYLFLTERIEWPDASANCARHGGHLVSIEDPSEQSFIERNIKMYQDNQVSFWIGLFKTRRGTWHWLDRSPLDYTNWRDGQPDDNSYGAIRATDGKWSTGNRWYDRGYICKTPKIQRQAPPTIASPVVATKTRGHITLAVVLVITAIAIGAVVAFFLFKKSGRRLPIPDKLSAFDNPLFSNNERTQPDLVDTNKLVANAEEENPGPVLTL